jgi:gluconokinase
VTMGTSSAMRVVVSPTQVTPADGLWLYSVNKERSLLGGALSEGGNIFAWLSQTLNLPDLEILDEQLMQMTPASHGLTILPMLAGERAPGWHLNARMTISGLTLHTTSEEIALASLEAVVFQLSRIYDQLRHALAAQVPQPRLIVNGAALLKSQTLRQILADTLQVPLELSQSSEASARGAALLALETLELLPDLAQLTPDAPVVVQPDPTRYAIYSAARERQQALYDLLLEQEKDR